MPDKDVLAMLGAQWIKEKTDAITTEFLNHACRITREDLGATVFSVRRQLWNDVLLTLFIWANMPDDLYEAWTSDDLRSPEFEVYARFAREQMTCVFERHASVLQAWHCEGTPATRKEHEYETRT